MSAKKTKQMKKETVEEYLARGGKVERLPYIPPERTGKYDKIHSAPPMPVHEMSLDEGAHFFAERPKRRVKKPDYSSVDMELISDELKELLGVKK